MAGIIAFALIGIGFILLTLGIFLYAWYFPIGVPFWVWIIIVAAIIIMMAGLISRITGQVASGGYDVSGYPYGYNYYYNRPAGPNDPSFMVNIDDGPNPLAVTGAARVEV